MTSRCSSEGGAVAKVFFFCGADLWHVCPVAAFAVDVMAPGQNSQYEPKGTSAGPWFFERSNPQILKSWETCCWLGTLSSSSRFPLLESNVRIILDYMLMNLAKKKTTDLWDDSSVFFSYADLLSREGERWHHYRPVPFLLDNSTKWSRPRKNWLKHQSRRTVSISETKGNSPAGKTHSVSVFKAGDDLGSVDRFSPNLHSRPKQIFWSFLHVPS